MIPLMSRTRQSRGETERGEDTLQREREEGWVGSIIMGTRGAGLGGEGLWGKRILHQGPVAKILL